MFGAIDSLYMYPYDVAVNFRLSRFHHHIRTKEMRDENIRHIMMMAYDGKINDKKLKRLISKADHYDDPNSEYNPTVNNAVGMHYESVFDASDSLKHFIDRPHVKKTLINPIVAIRNNESDNIKGSSYYRGFRVDVYNDGRIVTYRYDAINDTYHQTDIEAPTVREVFQQIDIRLFHERKDWIRVYIIYTEDSGDRGYIAGYTDINQALQAMKNKISYTTRYIEEIEVPFLSDELYYISWFGTQKNMGGLIYAKYYQETSNVYSSIDMAKQDYIWRKAKSDIHEKFGSGCHMTDTMIASDSDGKPFRDNEYDTYGIVATIKSFPLIQN